MKTINLCCATCHKPFDLALKEYTRQLKKNSQRVFYCSLRCSGKQNCSHLVGTNVFVKGSEAHTKAIRNAIATNSKCALEDRPFQEYVRRSRKRKHEFDLTLNYIKELWLSQKGRCAISNIPIELVGNAKNSISLASLDRIDSSKGYTNGNVQFVSACINYAKNAMSDEDAHTLMKLICENYVDNCRLKN